MIARPGSAAAPYGIVGGGRVARHFGHYLASRGLEVRRWSRGGPPVDEALADCPVILILIRDDAIQRFLSDHAFEDRILIHASGSVQTPTATAMHPLYTFGPELYPDELYPQIPFVCDDDGPTFEAVFPDLENPHWYISPTDRPLYHAACVMGGNFTTLLWNRAMQIFRQLGLPPEAAIPYLRRTCENVAEHGPEALTGPLARGDRRTIRSNLGALEGDPWAEVYMAIVKAARPGLIDSESEDAE